MDLSKFLRQNKLTNKRKTKAQRSSYAALLKEAKKILEQKTPFIIKDTRNNTEITVKDKIQKDKVIEEMFTIYRDKMIICYIFPIYKPTV